MRRPLISHRYFTLFLKLFNCSTHTQPAECSGSNLFRAFSEHFLHRMRIRNVFPPPPPHASVGSSSSQGEQATTRRTRVTFLQRGSPESKNVYRQVKNQPELLGVLSEFADFDVRVRKHACTQSQLHWFIDYVVVIFLLIIQKDCAFRKTRSVFFKV